jgi:phosphotransferase system enzyme I (PtsI)
MSIQVFGLPVSRGVAIGRAVLVASSRVDVAHYFIDEARIQTEIERLRAARDEVAAELTALQRELPHDAPHELSALLDVHLMLLHDDALTGATKQWTWGRWSNACSGRFRTIGRRRRRRSSRATSPAPTRWCWSPTTSRPPTC